VPTVTPPAAEDLFDRLESQLVDDGRAWTTVRVDVWSFCTMGLRAVTMISLSSEITSLGSKALSSVVMSTLIRTFS